MVAEPLCRCGHPEAAHYEYILNGQPQTRCRACDPSRIEEGPNVAMEMGTYYEAMYFAADHDYEPESEARDAQP